MEYETRRFSQRQVEIEGETARQKKISYYKMSALLMTSLDFTS